MTGPLKLASAGFDRAAHRRSDTAWLSDAWPRALVLLISPKSATAVESGSDGSERVALFRSGDAPADAPRRFLGIVEDQPCFAVVADPPDDSWRTLRELGASIDDVRASLLATAIALEQWHQRHPRCPRCGAATEEAQAGWTRVCIDDGSEHFPRTDPAVIMLVHDGGERALLGRGSQWPEGRFSTLAGFVEAGESLEAAVAREVFEEVGVRVTDVGYVASQPWPFPASLMLGFSARATGELSLQLDPAEVVEAGWFTRAEVAAARDWTDDATHPEPGRQLRGIPPRLSISRHLIDLWLADRLR